jgi:hypothetical protein
LENDKEYLTKTDADGLYAALGTTGSGDVDVPTKVSQLENDKGYITLNDIPNVDVPTKVSQLENDKEYLNEETLSSSVTIVEINRQIGEINNMITAAIATTNTILDIKEE